MGNEGHRHHRGRSEGGGFIPQTALDIDHAHSFTGEVRAEKAYNAATRIDLTVTLLQPGVSTLHLKKHHKSMLLSPMLIGRKRRIGVLSRTIDANQRHTVDFPEEQRAEGGHSHDRAKRQHV